MASPGGPLEHRQRPSSTAGRRDLGRGHLEAGQRPALGPEEPLVELPDDRQPSPARTIDAFRGGSIHATGTRAPVTSGPPSTSSSKQQARPWSRSYQVRLAAHGAHQQDTIAVRQGELGRDDRSSRIGRAGWSLD